VNYDYQRAKESLQTISVVKQDVFENSYLIFEKLKDTAKNSSDFLRKEITETDPRVVVEYKDVNKNEFWLQFGGDILIFSLHTNVFSFDRSHSLFNTKYITENHARSYFCMIEVFNFLNDSIRYNRFRDIGEMVARVFVNIDNHFFVEGIGAMGSMFSDLSSQKLDDTAMHLILETAIVSSISYDLWAPPFSEVRFLPLQAILEKNGNSPRTTSKRLGFNT
jgi:hypothetical protein